MDGVVDDSQVASSDQEAHIHHCDIFDQLHVVGRILFSPEWILCIPGSFHVVLEGQDRTDDGYDISSDVYLSNNSTSAHGVWERFHCGGTDAAEQSSMITFSTEDMVVDKISRVTSNE